MINQLNDNAFVSKYTEQANNTDAIHDVVDLAVLPFGKVELEKEFGIKFLHEEHDGWFVDIAAIDFDGNDCFLFFSRYTFEKNPEVYVQCSTLLDIPSRIEVLNFVAESLGIPFKEFLWVNKEELEAE